MSEKDTKIDILDEIKKRRDEAQSFWSDNYERGIEDKEFVTKEGAQWEKGAVAERQAAGKPSLEFNLVRAYCRQQINTQRQNRPQAKVVPVDNGADPEIAKLLEGLIKDIEEASDFESVADLAVENAVYGGLGFIRIVTDYVSPLSFNQEPKFMPVHNPQAVLLDPLSRALDGSDANWAIVAEWVAKDQIKSQYGDGALKDFDMDSKWFNATEQTVCIAEYFKKEEVADTLVMLEDGSTLYKSELLAELGVDEKELKESGLVIQERDTTRTEIKWCKVSGSEVLEETTFPGRFIPVIPVYGEVNDIENERFIFSLVHFAKTPQRLYNYWKSTEAHILQKTQDDILVASAESISGFEEQWQDPGKYAAVQVNDYNADGNPIPRPTRMGAAQPPVGILNATESAKMAITDILNMHAPIMGGQGNETSGVAIGMRQRQSETAQFHLQDNLNKSVRHSARILLDLIQALYTVPMMRRVIGVDGEAKSVQLFDELANGVLADPTIGRYDVRMDTGPSFNTQREQNFALMMQLLSMNPQLFSLIGDILLQNSPLLNAKEIAERIRTTMPPKLLGEGEKLDPEQAKAQIMQLDELVQKMTGDLEALQAQLNDKNQERQLEMFKVQLQAEKDIQVAQINASSRADVQELKGVTELIKQNLSNMQNMMQNIPQGWLQQGEGVGNYAPPQNDLSSQADWHEPPPETASSFESPATEQGFLMPEETAQTLALSPDQTEERAMINEGGLPPMELDNGPEQF